MYRDKKNSITVIWFLNTFPIFRYTSVPHTLIYLWRLTSLNKYEHCTFQNQNMSRVFYMNVSLKGTDCFQKSFDGIFILSDKEAFISAAPLIIAVTGETAGSTTLTAPPAGRQSVCI